MSSTDNLNAMQGHVAPSRPTNGTPTRVWAADVVAVHPDGTVNAQPVQSRATKVNVQVPVLYKPAVGDRILITDLNGDPQIPVMVGILSGSRPTVTGAKGGNVALASLITALANLGLVTDNTT